MNKLEEYKYELFPDSEELMEIYTSADNELKREGFNAAIALDLPVKFAKWLREEYSTQERWEHVGLDNNIWRNYETDEEKTTEELYQYWIDKIYNPEHENKA